MNPVDKLGKCDITVVYNWSSTMYKYQCIYSSCIGWVILFLLCENSQNWSIAFIIYSAEHFH